jgi:hypothetical protein
MIYLVRNNNAGYLERHDWRHTDADIDPDLGYIQDQLGQRGILVLYYLHKIN